MILTLPPFLFFYTQQVRFGHFPSDGASVMETNNGRYLLGFLRSEKYKFVSLWGGPKV